jgi:hypothetical protein
VAGDGTGVAHALPPPTENFEQTPVVVKEAYHYSDKQPSVVGSLA